MAITITAAAQNAADTAILILIDVSGPGKLEIWTLAFGTKLATLTMSNPAFGAPVAGVATASAITSDTNAANSGTAAAFKLMNGAGTEVMRGTVGTAAADIIFASGVTITATQIVAVSSMTVTMPGS